MKNTNIRVLERCFNHIIGLPQRDGQYKPLYDYEKIIFDSLATQNSNTNSYYNKHLWIKKATGLGISEFMLRFMAWLCLKDNSLSGSQMCIVTGPRINYQRHSKRSILEFMMDWKGTGKTLMTVRGFYS